jgi:hypothetical protein
MFRLFGICDFIPAFRSGKRGVRVVTNVERNAVDAEALIDERRFCGRRNRVVLAPQRMALKLATMLAHRGLRRWQSARFTEEITYKP